MASRLRATSAGRSTSGRVEGLAYSLQDTNANLRAVQRMLQDLGDGQTKSDVDDIPARSNARSQSHRPSARHAATHDTRTGNMKRRTAGSDRDEYRDRGFRNTERSNVQYYERMNTSLGDADVHEFHQCLRDLSSGQQRLAAELEREKERSRRLEAESLGKYGKDEALERVDRRLQRIDDEFRAERVQFKNKQDEVAKVSAELKLALERQRKKEAEEAVRSTMIRREEITDKTYLRQQLDQQAEQLKDYLQKTSEQRQTEQEIQNLKAQMTRLVGGVGEGGARRDTHDEHRERDRLEGYTRELLNLHHQLEASNARSEELKSQAQETIKLWKVKNQKLVKESEKHNQRADAAEHRIEELNKELEGQRSRSATVQQQFDLLLKEFNDLMSVRVDLDEKLTQRESQTNELTSLRKDLENELSDSRSLVETLEKELRVAKEQAYTATEECSELREHCKDAESSATSSGQMVHRLKKELQEMNASKNDLSSRFARASAENVQLSSDISELRKTHSSAVQELSNLQTRIRENKDSIQLSEIRSRYKMERAHAVAELEECKMQLQEERSINKLAKKQESNLREELERTTRELTMSRDECAAADQRCFTLRQELVAASFATEDGLTRSTEIELQLMDAKEALTKTLQNHDNDLATLAIEIEAIFNIVFDGKKSLSTSILHQPIENMFSENKPSLDRFLQIRNQLDRLKIELRHRHDSDVRARQVALDKNDKDCEFLLSEINRKNETLDRLTAERILEKELEECLSSEQIIERELDRLRVVQERDKSATENILDQGQFVEEYHKEGNDRLSPTKYINKPAVVTVDNKETQKVTVIRISSEDVPREDNDDIKTRYERLKESVGALQQDVSEVDMFRVHSSKRNSGDVTRATATRNRENVGRPRRPDHTVRPSKKSVRLVA